MNSLMTKIKKHSPEILVVSGVIGIIASTVMACRATRKLDDILEKKDDQLELMKERETEKKEIQKQTTKIYANTGVQLVKLYGPSAALGVLSLSCILESNNILRKRNAALTAAYAALDSSFKLYRSRVVERFGKDTDYQLLHNVQETEIEETVTDENGKTKKVKKKVNVVDPNSESAYVKYFTRMNPYWENDPAHLEMFFRSQQNYANDYLRVHKHLTLNDVYKMLGFPDTKAGMVVGWRYDPNNADGDNYVQFDIKEVYIPSDRGEFDRAYSIDFNVDGNIYDKMT